MTKQLSVVLATRNEEQNIKDCLASVKSLASEIIVVDEGSTDRTRELARSMGAKVYKVAHEEIFHITKQKALDHAKGDWILQLDADERVTPDLEKEIKEVVEMSSEQIHQRKIPDSKRRLFMKHQRLLENQGVIGRGTGDVVAFLLPRLNYFLGEPLIHGGVYPDPAIRLVKKGKARFPAKSVHEIMEVDGEIAWLFNDLVHRDSPTLFRYISRLNRYTDLKASELKKAGTPKNWFALLYYSLWLPVMVFLKYYLRHRAFLDGMRGFLWSFFSASHYTIGYFKYFSEK